MSEQRSADWYAARAGKVTASSLYKVMAKVKTGESADRRNYRAQLIAERLTGQPQENGFSNAAMQWGTETEPQARAMYAFDTNATVQEVGFVDHPTIVGFGASPDGLVGEYGLVEIKCPNTATHLDTLRGAPIDRKYILQMHGQMLCTGRVWCDFASFDPRLPDEMQLHIYRMMLDRDLADEIEAEVQTFLSEVESAVTELRAKYAPTNFTTPLAAG